MKINQRGISTIEAVLILGIVGIVGGTGWYVWHSKHQLDKNLTPDNSHSVSKHSSTPKKTSESKQATNNGSQATASTQSLYPADASTPASGICGGPNSSSTVTVTYNSGMPDPKCQKVTASQQLAITNSTNQTLNVTFAGKNFSVAANSSYTVSGTFGSYLAAGVHRVTFSPSSSAELWLQ